MNEPKRRGRPTNAEREAKAALLKAPLAAQIAAAATPEFAAAVTAAEAVIEAPMTPYVDGAGVVHLATSMKEVKAEVEYAVFREAAQTYAMRVWSGQAADLKRSERIARVERALEGQNLPTAGIQYPGNDDDEEWSEEDSAPVVWRKDRP